MLKFRDSRNWCFTCVVLADICRGLSFDCNLALQPWYHRGGGIADFACKDFVGKEISLDLIENRLDVISTRTYDSYLADIV